MEEIDRNFFFAEVILPFQLYQSFTYSIPNEWINNASIGKRVLVQFGKSKVFTGIISQIHQKKPEKYQVKEILEILDNYAAVNQIQLDFWNWVASYYCCSVGEVMAAALPASMKMESAGMVMINEDFNGDISSLNERELLLVEALSHKPALSIPEVQELLAVKGVFHILKSLHLQGIILMVEEIEDSYKPKEESVITLNSEYHTDEAIQSLFEKLKRSQKQADALMIFRALTKEKDFVFQKELIEKANCSSQIIKSLVDKNVFDLKKINIDRVVFETAKREEFTLKSFQQEAKDKINHLFQKHDVVLLHGITSSGKTNIYMKIIEEVLNQGKQVLYLVPEIALTAQLIQKLYGYFGEITGIYHSKYSPNERFEIWHKTLKEEYKLVLGVRSALFLPFKNLGLIVIDEEHETTFKQQNPAPRYQARDSAIVLAKMHQAKVLLGTATPSFESFYNAQNGKYGYVFLNKRFSEVTPPEVVISDLTIDHAHKKLKGHLGSDLFKEINETIEKNNQVILFINRRGYAPYLQCNTCGYIPKCINCDISLTYHKSINKLKCHYCGYKQSIPSKCDLCGNPAMLMKGFGTEKIEDDISLLYPDQKMIRMDYDTTRTRKAYQKIISGFEKGDASILVGTQMVTKGLDFEKVMLVGILNADQMISYPDFRAAERSFQLISQVSGRAGRREKRGKVVIQTFDPKHVLFTYLLESDYFSFYEYEMKIRKEFNYPPYSRILKLNLKSKKVEMLMEGGKYLGNRLKSLFGNRILGPEFPPVSKINNEFQFEILIKFEQNNQFISKSKELIMKEIGEFVFMPLYRGIKVIIDVDVY